MHKTLKILFLFIGVFTPTHPAVWGFYAHEKINRLAVFTLPPEMIGFYKANIEYISKTATDPDKRRYVMEEEGARHYIDIDHYGDSALFVLPRDWTRAREVYHPDTLTAHGILPWHIYRMYARLRDAFMVKDPAEILKVSAELGHYIADAHVPLHTTENYNGQLTGQEGIHGLWESRLPELFDGDYDYFVGKAEYLEDPQLRAWRIVRDTYQLVDEVLADELPLAARFGEKKYSFETRGKTTVKVYSAEYAKAYHQSLNGMVERQMQASIKSTGDFWLTAWVDAGQPDLQKLIDFKPTAEELQQNREELQQLKTDRKTQRGH